MDAAAPTFFWGGEATGANAISSLATRLILMAVWRNPSQP